MKTEVADASRVDLGLGTAEVLDLAKDDTAEHFNIATDDENDNAPELVSESNTEFARIRFRTRPDDSEDTVFA